MLTFVMLMALAAPQPSSLIEFLASPLYIALYEAVTEQATSPECVEKETTRRQQAEVLHATAAWNAFVASPELRVYNDLIVEQVQRCPGTQADDAECAELAQQVDRAREASNTSCAMRAVVAEPSHRAIMGTYTSSRCRNADYAVAEAASLASYIAQRPTEWEAFSVIPWRSLNDSLAALRASKAHDELLDSPEYAELLSTAMTVQQCYYGGVGGEDVCNDTTNQRFREQAEAVGRLPAWQTAAQDAAYQQVVGKLNTWANACHG